MSQTAQTRADDGRRLAAGDGGDDADGLAVGHRGVEALEEADVVIGDEHVDEAAQAAGVVEEPLREPGCTASRLLSTSPTVAPSTATSDAPPVRVRRVVGTRTVTLIAAAPGWGRDEGTGPAIVLNRLADRPIPRAVRSGCRGQDGAG